MHVGIYFSVKDTDFKFLDSSNSDNVLQAISNIEILHGLKRGTLLQIFKSFLL